MKRILVIEDDMPLCWLLQKILSRKHDVTIMRNGMDAWSWLTDGNVPDLIISDLRMPSLDGIELLEFISNSGIFRHVPVLILSGDDDPVKKIQCKELGAVNFILKPFEPQLFMAEVERVLSRTEEIVGHK